MRKRIIERKTETTFDAWFQGLKDSAFVQDD